MGSILTSQTMKERIQITIPIVIDSQTGQYYFEVHHTKASQAPDKTNSFIIGVAITLNTKNQLGTNLTLNAGNYPYDSSLGLHGGYKLPLMPLTI